MSNDNEAPKTHTCARCGRTGRAPDLFGTRTMPTKADPDRRVPQPWCRKCRRLAAKASRSGEKTPPIEVAAVGIPDSYDEVLALCKQHKIPLYASRRRRPVADLREALAEALASPA